MKNHMRNYILLFKSNKAPISIKYIRSRFNVSRKTIYKHINRLLSLKLIERIAYGLYQITSLGKSFKTSRQPLPKCNPQTLKKCNPPQAKCYHYINHVKSNYHVLNKQKESIMGTSSPTDFLSFQKTKFNLAKKYAESFGYLNNVRNISRYCFKILWNWFKNPEEMQEAIKKLDQKDQKNADKKAKKQVEIEKNIERRKESEKTKNIFAFVQNLKNTETKKYESLRTLAQKMLIDSGIPSFMVKGFKLDEKIYQLQNGII